MIASLCSLARKNHAKAEATSSLPARKLLNRFCVSILRTGFEINEPKQTVSHSSFQNTSLTSIIAAVVLPLAVLLIVAKTGTDFWLLLAFSVLMAALAIWRHRGNIVRLLNGTENRFGKK